MAADLPPRQFEMTLEIDAPKDAVWKALSTAEGIAHWFSSHAEVEPGAGGKVVWEWEDGYHWAHVIDVWEPGQRLLTRYESAVDDGRGGKVPLFCDFTLSSTGGTTTLRLVHSGFGEGADFDKEYDGISQGWPIELQSMKVALERHLGEQRQLAWGKGRTTLSPEQVAKQLFLDSDLIAPSPAELGVGEAYTLRLGDGLELAGQLTTAPSNTGIAGTIDSPHSGYFHAHAFSDPKAGLTQAWLWVALYGAPEPELRRLRAAVEARLAAALPGVELVGKAGA